MKIFQSGEGDDYKFRKIQPKFTRNLSKFQEIYEENSRDVSEGTFRDILEV